MLEMFHDFYTSKTTQLIFNTLKTLLVLYTFGIVVSVSSAFTFFKKKAKEGEFLVLII